MSETAAITPARFLSRYFPEDTPAPWLYAIWYTFLLLWMQGEALLNTLWVTLLILSLPYIHQGIERVRPYRWLWISAAIYLGLRLISVTYAIDTKYALYGITDDLRIFSIGLLLLSYVHTKEHLRKALFVTLAGFALLAWHALILHWLSHQHLNPIQYVEFGSLAHVNYAAAYTSVVLFSLLVVSRHISFRWMIATALAALPLCIMQGPLGGRTSLLMLFIAMAAYLAIKRPGWIVALLVTLAIAIIGSVMTSSKYASRQFENLDNPMQQKTIYIRVDIWKSLFRIWQDHPMGIGPRNFNAIDMNPYREWIYENIPKTAEFYYHKKAMPNQLKDLDLNKEGHFVTDAHNHYVSLFTENGPLGLLAFLSFLLAASAIAIKHSFAANNWTSGFGETATGGLFILAGSAMMASLFYQSGGIIMVMLIAFLLASIAIHGTEKEDVVVE